MIFNNVSSFLKDGLPHLVGGMDRLNAVFSTYNDVRDHESGHVETGKEGLSVFVHNGEETLTVPELIADLNRLAVGFIADSVGDVSTAAAIADDIVIKGKSNQEAIESAVHNKAKSGKVLAVVYAGLTAFSEAMSAATRIKKENLKAKVVIVSCDCDAVRKSRLFREAVDRGEIDAAIAFGYCGGSDEMAAVLRGLVDHWPMARPLVN